MPLDGRLVADRTFYCVQPVEIQSCRFHNFQNGNMLTQECEPGEAEEVAVAQVPNPAGQWTVVNDLVQPGLGAREEDGVDHVACADSHHEDVHPLKG